MFISTTLEADADADHIDHPSDAMAQNLSLNIPETVVRPRTPSLSNPFLAMALGDAHDNVSPASVRHNAHDPNVDDIEDVSMTLRDDALHTQSLLPEAMAVDNTETHIPSPMEDAAPTNVQDSGGFDQNPQDTRARLRARP